MTTLILSGAPRVRDGTRDMPLSARESALLAWLHAEGPTPRVRLAALLWPAAGEARARANLRQTLLRLKRAGADLLTETDGTLALAAGVAVQDDGAAPWLAPFEFDDAPELAEWLARRRTHARGRRVEARLAQARSDLQGGAFDAALAAADEVLALEPESEEAHRLRMEAFYLRGDRAAAIEAWDRCREALRRAFGVAPSASTNELGRLILASDAVAPARRGELPVALRRPPRLIGRDEVLGALATGWALHPVLVVAGSAGVGKSRLLAEFLREREPVVALAARPGDAEATDAAFARLLAAALAAFKPALREPVRRACATWVPALRGAGATQTASATAIDRQRALNAAADALIACGAAGCAAIVFDDLQFADAGSVAALQSLADALCERAEAAGVPGAPRLVLATRPDELGPAAQRLLDRLAASRRSARVDLAPLSPDDVRELVGTLGLGELDAPALADALAAQVGGHPAFLLDALKTLWLDGLDRWRSAGELPLPASLRASVERRLARLSPPALQLAQLAAVAQVDFDAELAAAATGRTVFELAPLLAELERAQVFAGAGFAIDLVADAVRAGLPESLVPPLHRLVAERLIARDGAPGRIAHHLEAAGERAAAAPHLLHAARIARDAWQLREAEALFRRAAEALELAPARETRTARAARRRDAFDAWIGVARSRMRLGERDEGAAAIARAGPLALGTRDAIVLDCVHAMHAFNTREPQQAARIGDRMCERLLAEPDACSVEEAVEVARIVTALAPEHRRPDRVEALCAAIARRLEADPSPAARTQRAGLRRAHAAHLNWIARADLALAELETALREAEADGDPAPLVQLGVELWRAQAMCGQSDAALDTLARTEAVYREARLSPVSCADLRHFRGGLLLARGAMSEALELLESACAEIMRAEQYVPAAFELTRGIAWTMLGAHDEAAQAFDRCGASPRTRVAQVVAWQRARLAVARGDSPDDWLAVADEQEQPGPTSGVSLKHRVIVGRIAGLPLQEALTLCDALRTGGMVSQLKSAELVAARAALASDPARAASHVRAALDLPGDIDPWADEPGRWWLEAVEVLDAAGARDAATEALGRALEWLGRTASDTVPPGRRAGWLEVNPAHRALRTLGRSARLGGPVWTARFAWL